MSTPRHTANHLLPRPADGYWYKDAVIYQLHVKAFFDSNNDGVGDFPGLIQKLDYLQDLGVTALWLLPFYPSPQKDDGYDIADYHNVHPAYGTRNDFRLFVREAHRRGLRVITELVINHTSDQHQWFQAARRAAPGTMKRNFYVWSDTDTRYAGTRIIFTDTEVSNWKYDEMAGAYYWHRFFSHQPDLNFDNPLVLKAVLRVMRFWLDAGVDGLRLDAIPYLCEREGTNNENLPETHAIIKEIRAVIDAHYKDRMLLGEANQWPEDVRDYFGDGDECHMAFHFPLMPRMYMAIAQEDRHPIVEIMQQTPDIPESCQWAIFLRNHDELTLEMVTDKERDYMYQMYAADTRARVNLGIRRRLAPLMDNDLDRIRLMNALLLSMPGSPVIYYGDELGMGDNVYLGDRNGVRTPMQWSPDRNGGFSRADPQGLYLPPIMDPIYGYQSVNVEAQTRDTSSLLSWTRRLLAIRKSYAGFGRGTLTFLRPGNRKILAYVRSHGDEHLLCVANLSRTAQPVELDLSAHKGRTPVELLGRTPFPPIGDLPYLVTLPGHGFYWFRLSDSQDAPPWHEEVLQREETPMLVFFDGWASLFPERVAARRGAMAELLRRQFECEALPRFLSSQRWFSGHTTPARAQLIDHALWTTQQGSWLLGLYCAEGGTPKGEGIDRAHCNEEYFVPLSLVWDSDEERSRALHTVTVARIRQHAHIGCVGDAMADEQFVRATVAAIGGGQELPCGSGHIRYVPGAAYGRLIGMDLTQLPVRRPGNESSNSTVALGHLLFLKIYRRLQHGVSPELEVGRYLTDVVNFSNGVPLMGSIEYRAEDGTVSVLALLQGYVENQGDGWSYTLDYLARSFEASLATAAASQEAAVSPAEAHGAYLALIGNLARRTAELHLALASETNDPAFKPEPLTSKDIQGLAKRIGDEVDASLDLIWQRLPDIPEAAREIATELMARRKVLKQRVADAVPKDISALKSRHHGDFHLGQVLLAQNDFIIIDFEGEPTRPIEQRREKHSPLRDVAGMLRSFDYAARIALFSLDSKHERETGALDKLAEEWRTQTEQTYLKSYAERIDNPALYGDWEHSRGLLDLFLLEKALYELRYELSHRPEWVEIPLRGLMTMMGMG